MKKSGLLNTPLAKALSDLRHTDTLCVADCGLPCPTAVETIDLALKLGTPSFLETLAIVVQDMGVEKIILAAEIREKNPAILDQIHQLLPEPAIEFVPHSQFKQMTSQCRAIVRTGEASPYANIILQASCIF